MKKGTMKKITALLLAAALMSLCACTGSTGESSAGSSASSEAVSQISADESGDGSSSDPSEISDAQSENESSINSEPVIEPEPSEESVSAVPAEWQDDGIFSNKYDRAYELMSEMTLEEKVGQMMFAACPYNGAQIANELQPGGYVLFGSDFSDKTRDEVIKDIASYQQSSKIPMAIASDEEGGTVTRISWNDKLVDHFFQSPRDVFDEGGLDAIREDTAEKSAILESLGVNVNLAPVCDISRDPADFMYDRSLGESPEVTASFVRTFVDASQQNGVSATLKHFPGYGSNDDTHIGMAFDDRTYETFVQNDFIPFSAGIEEGAHFVLVSHNIVKCMDESNPASISPEVHRILREELGFTGLIITDDMSMSGVGGFLSVDYSAYVAAVLAGNDMLIVGDIESAYGDILAAARDEVIDSGLIDHAVMRVLAWKLAKGMIK